MIGKKYTKKNNKAPCPCGPTKSNKVETFVDSEAKAENITVKINKIDNTIKKMIGKSKLVIGRRHYKLKKYRWFIVISLLLLLIVMVAAFRCETPSAVTNQPPIIISSMPAPVPSAPLASTK
jgi:hypothetical protein